MRYTLKVYSMVNVDVCYLNKLASLLSIKYPKVPAGKHFMSALKNMHDNARKNKTVHACACGMLSLAPCQIPMLISHVSAPLSSGQHLGTMSLADLSPKAVHMIRELGFPVTIDEIAPSMYIGKTE